MPVIHTLASWPYGLSFPCRTVSMCLVTRLEGRVLFTSWCTSHVKGLYQGDILTCYTECSNAFVALFGCCCCLSGQIKPKKKIIKWESDSRKDPGLAVGSCPMELLCSVPGWPWRLQIKQRVNLFTSFSTFYSNCSSDLFWWLMLSGSVSQEHRSASRGEPGVKPTSTFLRSCFIDKPRQT